MVKHSRKYSRTIKHRNAKHKNTRRHSRNNKRRNSKKTMKGGQLLEPTLYSNPHTFFGASKQGAVTGCVGSSCGGPGVNIKRDATKAETDLYAQKGGMYYEQVFNNDAGMGNNRGGLTEIVAKNNCGAVNPLNLNTSKQHQKGGSSVVSYGYTKQNQHLVNELRGSYFPITRQTGGYNELCNNINSINSFNQVEKYWSKICPGAVKLYKTYLTNVKDKYNNNVLSILREYTKVFCLEEQALENTNKRQIRENFGKMRKILAQVKKTLQSTMVGSRMRKIQMMKLHSQIRELHLERVRKHLQKKSRTLKRELNKKNNKTRKNMKGGYHQYGSNIAHTNTYSLSNNAGHGGMFANPMPRNIMNNCHSGSYNHYTGETKQAPIFEQDVPN